MVNDKVEDPIENIRHYLTAWKRTYYGWGAGHFILLGLGAICSFGVAGGTTFLEPTIIQVFGIIALVAVGVTNLYSTGAKYNKFNTAWSTLNKAIVEYDALTKAQMEADIRKVIKAYGDGENIINGKIEKATDTTVDAIIAQKGIQV